MFDGMVSVAIDSPIIKIPKTTIAAKKDFSGDRKQINFNAKIEKPVSKQVNCQYLFVIYNQNTSIIIVIKIQV